MWQWHVLGCCANAGDDNEGTTVNSSQEFDATRVEENLPITSIWKVSLSALSAWVIQSLIGSIQVLHGRGLYKENR